MNHINLERIDLGKLENVMKNYERRWIAISEENEIVASGDTYKETLTKSKDKNVVLFKVPPLDVSLAP